MKRFAAIALIFLAFLSPSFQVAAGLPVVRLEDAILVVFLVALCVRPGFWLRKLPRGGKDKITIAFAIMMGVALLSIGASGLRGPIVLNDFMILPMIFKYWLIYKLAQSVVEPRTRLYCLYALAVAVAISAMIGILEFHNIAGVNNWLAPLYEKGAAAQYAYDEVEEVLSRRVGGTHGDPRHFGFLLVTGLAVCGSLYLYTRRQTERVLSVCVAGLCLIALIYTMSRTPMLTTVIIAVTALVIYHRVKGIHARMLVWLLLVGVLVGGVFFCFSTGAFKERVFRTDTDSYQTSAYARKRDFIRPFAAVLEDPSLILLGKGPSKANTRTSGHNDVGWYFQRFGLPGLAFYLFLFWYGIKRAHLVFKRTPWPNEQAIHMAALLIFLNWLVFIMAENIFKDSQMMAVNMFFMGLILPAAVPAAVRLPLRQRLNAMTSLARPTRRVPWPRPQRPFAMRRASRITGPWARRVIRPRTAAPLPAHRSSAG
jgi:hypothetical protein